MPKWTKPSEGLPEVDVGDRVLVIVVERLDRRSLRKTPRLVILERTETGWMSPDMVYAGYTPEDGEYWSLERDVCSFVGYVGKVT